MINMKITVNITQPELNAIEDIAVCWNLCDKHKKLDSEIEMFKASNECKDCIEIQRKLTSKAMNAWSKMVHAYNIARYGKCSCEN